MAGIMAGCGSLRMLVARKLLHMSGPEARSRHLGRADFNPFQRREFVYATSWRIFLAMTLTAVIGCGRNGPEVVPVAGKITYAGGSWHEAEPCISPPPNRQLACRSGPAGPSSTPTGSSGRRAFRRVTDWCRGTTTWASKPGTKRRKWEPNRFRGRWCRRNTSLRKPAAWRSKLLPVKARLPSFGTCPNHSERPENPTPDTPASLATRLCGNDNGDRRFERRTNGGGLCLPMCHGHWLPPP